MRAGPAESLEPLRRTISVRLRRHELPTILNSRRQNRAGTQEAQKGTRRRFPSCAFVLLGSFSPRARSVVDSERALDQYFEAILAGLGCAVMEDREEIVASL